MFEMEFCGCFSDCSFVGLGLGSSRIWPFIVMHIKLWHVRNGMECQEGRKAEKELGNAIKMLYASN